jgi:hypothetical protein
MTATVMSRAPIWGKLISACEATQKLKLEERFGALFP